MGMYRAFVLYLDGVPAAFVTGVLVRDSFKVPHVAYDPAVPGKYSVGKVVHFKAIEYCIQEGYREYDLTRGSEGYKRLLGGQSHTNLHLRVYRSRLAMMIEPLASRAVPFVWRQAWLRRLYRGSAGIPGL
jgi:CelD/BcsL family acetyltransferase involved in cellulose biosynthesis